MRKSFMVSLCEVLLFISQRHFAERIRDFFFLKGNPHTLGERTDLISDECDLVVHKLDANGYNNMID